MVGSRRAGLAVGLRGKGFVVGLRGMGLAVGLRGRGLGLLPMMSSMKKLLVCLREVSVYGVMAVLPEVIGEGQMSRSNLKLQRYTQI